MERVDKICNDFLKHQKKRIKMSEKKEPTPITNVASALKEAGYQYIALLLILISNLWGTGDWNTIGSLALAYAVFLFAGWVKKIAEVKISELIAQSGIKDKEILLLKEIKIKLEAEVKNLVDKLQP